MQQMQQLDPKAVWIFFIGYVMSWFFLFIFFMGPLLLILVFALEDLGILKWLLVAAPALIVFSWVWANLTHRFYRYELRDDGFRKEFGIIWKQYTTVPYDRIQNVDIYRGVFDRIWGLSTLNIQTAGGTRISAEGVLPGLSHEVAEQLRDELISRARQPRTTNQGL